MASKKGCSSCRKVPTLKPGMTRIDVLVAYLETGDWKLTDIPEMPIIGLTTDDIKEALARADASKLTH